MSQQLGWVHRQISGRQWRLAAGVLVTSVLGVTACGSQEASPPVAHVVRTSTTVTGSRSNALLLATKCLRQHGLPDLPDPVLATAGPAKGQMVLEKQALLAYPSSAVNQAENVCSTALAQAGISSGPDATASPQEIQYLLAFAHCVRNHGVSNFPDPNSQGGFNLAGTGINGHELTATELAAAKTCLPTAHGDVHIPSQGSGSSHVG